MINGNDLVERECGDNRGSEILENIRGDKIPELRSNDVVEQAMETSGAREQEYWRE